MATPISKPQIMQPVRSTLGDIDWESLIGDITGAIKPIIQSAVGPQPYFNPATGTYGYPANYNPITGQYNPNVLGSTSATTLIIYGVMALIAYKVFIK